MSSVHMLLCSFRAIRLTNGQSISLVTTLVHAVVDWRCNMFLRSKFVLLFNGTQPIEILKNWCKVAERDVDILMLVEYVAFCEEHSSISAKFRAMSRFVGGNSENRWLRAIHNSCRESEIRNHFEWHIMWMMVAMMMC